ncbi:hypothetical protein ACJJTC_010972 [Scirpophaga incertulas]
MKREDKGYHHHKNVHEKQCTLEGVALVEAEVLADQALLKNRLKKHKDNIPPPVMDLYRRNKSGVFCSSRYVQMGMTKYDKVAKVVAPKKQRLAAAQAVYGMAMAALAVKQAQLKEVQLKLTVKEEHIYRVGSYPGNRTRAQQPQDETKLTVRRCTVCGLKNHSADKCRFKNYKCQKCYATPIVPVVKENGNIRVAGDFSITLKKDLLIDKYLMPRIEEVYAKIGGGKSIQNSVSMMKMAHTN